MTFGGGDSRARIARPAVYFYAASSSTQTRREGEGANGARASVAMTTRDSYGTSSETRVKVTLQQHSGRTPTSPRKR